LVAFFFFFQVPKGKTHLLDVHQLAEIGASSKMCKLNPKMVTGPEQNKA